MDTPQTSSKSMMATITKILDKFRQVLDEHRFEEYYDLLKDFFLGKIELRLFLQDCDRLVPVELKPQHEILRNALCDLGETRLSEKRQNRADKQKEGIFEFPSVGDTRAIIALKVAKNGLTMENGMAETIHEAMKTHIIEFLLYAIQVDVEDDGFITTDVTTPMKMNDLKAILEARCADERLPKEQRDLSERTLEQLDEKYLELELENDE